MDESRKIMLWFFVVLAILSVAAYIRVRVWPPKPESAERAVVPYSSDPACAALEKELDNRLGRDSTGENSEAEAFLKKYSAIENSNLPTTEKEIRLRRLVEASDIEDIKRNADSDVSYMGFLRRLKDAGCLDKR